MKIKPLRIGVIAAYIIQIILNASAGSSVGQQSDRFQTLVTPAGYTFAIWGLIFAATLGYTVYQALPRTQDSRFLDRIAPFAIVSFLASGVWIPLFLNDYFIIANVIMIVLLAGLTGAGIVIINQARRRPLSSAQQWLVNVPLSIYLGWITVATVANFSLTLAAYEWGGWGLSETVWAIGLLVTAGLIASYVVFAGRGNIAYALTLAWALTGVIVANLTRPTVLGAAVAAIILIVVTLIVSLIRRSGQQDDMVRRSARLT